MPLLKLDQVVIKDLGKKQYQETFSAMKDFVAEGEDESIWMLEHDPVFTLGTAADQKHILKRTDIDIFQADRGGEVTYHGPGQLVIYFLLNIKKRNLGPKKFVKQLEDLVQKTLLDFQIQSNTIRRLTRSLCRFKEDSFNWTPFFKRIFLSWHKHQC